MNVELECIPVEDSAGRLGMALRMLARLILEESDSAPTLSGLELVAVPSDSTVAEKESEG